MTNVIATAKFRKKIVISANTVVFKSAFQLECHIMVGKSALNLFVPTQSLLLEAGTWIAFLLTHRNWTSDFLQDKSLWGMLVSLMGSCGWYRAAKCALYFMSFIQLCYMSFCPYECSFVCFLHPRTLAPVLPLKQISTLEEFWSRVL